MDGDASLINGDAINYNGGGGPFSATVSSLSPLSSFVNEDVQMSDLGTSRSAALEVSPLAASGSVSLSTSKKFGFQDIVTMVTGKETPLDDVMVEVQRLEAAGAPRGEQRPINKMTDPLIIQLLKEKDH
ncbi:MAG: hypothetical protein HWE08_12120 [Alphaproteobacteria bacterium]|nr:hypothetical protein [Alphaproteobacteria bacterium]